VTVAIVYYSRTGNTRFVAECVVEKTEGALIPLEEKGTRKGLWGFLKSGFQASLKRSSRLLGQPCERTASFDTLYLCSPIWAGNGNPAINAFLGEADLTGKKVVIVTLQTDPKHGGSDRVHAYLADRVVQCGGPIR